ncbi:MAG: hypothetical protein H7Y41_04980 [Hyphomonadaceae bacterium]|nr:hypothetical protein [Clostridia bacterium]
MYKLWGKLYTNQQMTHQVTLPCEAASYYDFDTIKVGIADVCKQFDVGMPVLLPSHRDEFAKFGRASFRQGDFLEDVLFDRMEIQIFSDKKKVTRPRY